MKIGKAYCPELDIDLTIYQLRNWHYDEEEYAHIDADNLTFKCQEKYCLAELYDVNATKPRPKQTPHFRTLPNNEHTCTVEDDDKLVTSGTSATKHGKDKAYRENDFPDEFIVKRKPSQRQKLAEGKTQQPVIIEPSSNTNTKAGNNTGRGSNRTSDLEHIVECFLGHQDNPEALKKKFLTIAKERLSYRQFFTPISYFNGENKQRIYYGQLKEISAYGDKDKQRFILNFKKWPTINAHDYPLSIYLSQNTITRYRKRGLFKNQMLDFLAHPDQDILCFFFGCPELVERNYKNKPGSYNRLEAKITNLDHLVLSFS